MIQGKGHGQSECYKCKQEGKWSLNKCNNINKALKYNDYTRNKKGNEINE